MTVRELLRRLLSVSPDAEVLVDMADDRGRLWELDAVDAGIYCCLEGTGTWVTPEEAARMAGSGWPWDDWDQPYVCLRVGEVVKP